MSLIDVAIPLVIGLLLVTRPHLFTKRSRTGEDAARKLRMLRIIGYVLLSIAGMYALIAVVGPR